jgi:class 3 adenylate cyclase
MVTVLFADLVDSTGLAQRLDAERAREILGRFFDAASEELLALRGRPEKFIGDAVMAVFGLPTVHEDDALRAVRAGLAIRARTVRLGGSLGLSEPLDVHVGIASGEAATGLGPAGQLLVTGPVVNAAARLQAAAGPGEVLAGETTVALTANEVSYGDRRSVEAKGFDGGLVGFPVEDITPRSSRRTIPFVGRTSELAILRESLHRAASTGHPALVTIVGEPGIGKSRLADELVAGLGDDVPVLAGHARPFTDSATFAAAATIVAELAGLDEQDPPDKAKRRLNELVERHGIAQDHVVERLSLLFGMAERPSRSSFVQDVQSGFLSLVDGIAGDAPTVLVFEDAHTLKAPMLDLIERPSRDPSCSTRDLGGAQRPRTRSASSSTRSPPPSRSTSRGRRPADGSRTPTRPRSPSAPTATRSSSSRRRGCCCRAAPTRRRPRARSRRRCRPSSRLGSTSCRRACAS